ncbi:hypothetical protein IJU97_05650 [bacterium]|nr:hypothetical protein [bacterium]
MDLILKKLSEINEEELKGLKQEKVTLQSTQEYLESQGRSEYFEKFYSENRERFSFQERTTFSLRMNQQFIQELIAL